jgi:ABC-type branched-subunit amino acid transport system permease subunit
LKHTRYGRLLTVVIFNRETAAAFGINVTRGLHRHLHHRSDAGRRSAAPSWLPKISVTLGIGVEGGSSSLSPWSPIGGMGSIEGALIGALIVGICRATAVHLVPQLELFVIYAGDGARAHFRPSGCSPRPHRGRSDGRQQRLVIRGEALTCGRAQISVERSPFVAVAAAAPCAAGWLVSLATIAFANALVVLGLVILWRAGLVPVRQALFYATGAYAVALLSRYAGWRDVFLLVAVGAARRHLAFWSASCWRAIATSSSRCSASRCR